MPYVTIEQEVYVDLDEFDTDDLEAELLKRNSHVTRHSRPAPSDNQLMLMTIFEKRRTGQDYQQELDLFIYNNLGRIV